MGGSLIYSDILFDNIEHMFFQPCTHEMYVIIHFHLKDAIMVGKRKTVDLQVCREAVDGGAGDETSNRKHRRAQYGDEDELQAEQTERRKKKALDKEFSEFAKAIQEAVSFPFSFTTERSSNSVGTWARNRHAIP